MRVMTQEELDRFIRETFGFTMLDLPQEEGESAGGALANLLPTAPAMAQSNGEDTRASTVQANNADRQTANAYTNQGRAVIQTGTARNALPVTGCAVTILERQGNEKHLRKFLRTDLSGRTAKVELGAPNRELSLSPGNPRPFSTYFIDVTHPEYQAIMGRTLLVFDGELSLAWIEMQPLPVAT